MQRNRARVREQSVHLLLISAARRTALGVMAFITATTFALVVSSAPQSESGQSNANQQPAGTDWQAVAQALGKAGSMQPGDVYKVSLPRSDLNVTVNGIKLKPALALGSWVAFKKMGEMTMVMVCCALSSASSAASRVTSAARSSSANASVPAGRMGSTR